MPAMLHHPNAVVFNLGSWLLRPIGKLTILMLVVLVKSLVSMIVDDYLWSDYKAKLAILPIVECVIDNLNVTLILDILQFVGRETHKCCTILLIEVNEDRVRYIRKLR